MTNKKDLFEYFLSKLIEWHCVYHQIDMNDFNGHSTNDLSKLKLIKLHFFTCSTKDEALDFFDNFYAMPYGHVESSIYPTLDSLVNYRIESRGLTILNNVPNFAMIDQDKLNLMDESIAILKSKNPDIISFSPFSLVELSHKWFSWSYTFEEARRENLYSKKISPEVIKKETKFYCL